jgi:hypothetical protein
MMRVHQTERAGAAGGEAFPAALPWYIRVVAGQGPLGFKAGDANLYRYVFNNPTNMVDPSGLAGKGSMTYPLGGGAGHAYVEWFPDQGVAEMKVFDKQGNELVRYRWDKATNTIETITRHGGKNLPGASRNFLNHTSFGICHCQKTMVNKAGGAFSRNMIPQSIRDSFPKPNAGGGGRAGGGAGRPGFIDGRALAGMLGTTVIVGGVSYAYNEYLGIGEAVGMDLATRAGLGEALMLADRDEAFGPGIGMLPGKSFTVVVNGRNIHVQVVEAEPGKKYLTAWYTKDRWSLFYGSYRETVELIKVEHNYRVYNCK